MNGYASSPSSSSSGTHQVMGAPPSKVPFATASPQSPRPKSVGSTPLTSTAAYKASPSDVMFGQPPGAHGPVQHLGALSSDSSPSSISIAASSGSRRGSRSNSKSRSGKISAGFSPITTGDPPSARRSSQIPLGSQNSTVLASSAPSGGASSSSGEPGPASAPLPEAVQQATPGLLPSLQDAGEDVKVLPYLVDDADSDDIVALVADMLNRLMLHNDTLPLHPSALTRFHSRATPAITIHSYLRRIARYTSLDKACTLILLVYIDRVCERMKGFTICSLTVHRFVCAAVVCASKALCDAFSTNGHYARVGGISLVELNMLEKEFLNIIDWRLTCSGALLQHYYVSLVTSHPSYTLASDPHQTSSLPSSPEGSDEEMEVEDPVEVTNAPSRKGSAVGNRGRERDTFGDEESEGRKRRGPGQGEADRVAQQRS